MATQKVETAEGKSMSFYNLKSSRSGNAFLLKFKGFSSHQWPLTLWRHVLSRSVAKQKKKERHHRAPNHHIDRLIKRQKV